ncbi:class I SAM-dependent methyltransferase [Treponema sp.]|uniref:class I SAM-dependent methyltransferase n=1 Tax=Treponema sp. TaxID=166 RepID=UPI00298E6C68|nr:class I SAM-dependent methyltransferase [Treponema sp.]MCR5614065.1 class I SAM-dependent methyltransferase [Treponema sp.]
MNEFKQNNEKLENQKTLFANRLKRKLKELKKWARKNKISCYRLYDRDIPEIPLSLDVYEFLPFDVTDQTEAARFLLNQNERVAANDPTVQKEIALNTYAVLYLYERPYEKDESEEEFWFEQMAQVATEVLNIEKNHLVKKERKRQRGTNQYEKESTQHDLTPNSDDPQDSKNAASKARDSVSIKGLTQECGELFNIDLTSYIDTGLFFDHRPLRSKIRDIAQKKCVLNLFCYTGSFSVYAAQGGARKVESVDLSNTYLNLAKENMKLNNFTDKDKFIYTRADCVEFLKEKALKAKDGSLKDDERYDIIILDPPTFSNSKNTYTVLDINRDWVQLVKDCLNILSPGGVLYFSTNSTKLVFDKSKLPQATVSGKVIMVTDITAESIPKDFEGTKCHKAWEFKIGK